MHPAKWFQVSEILRIRHLVRHRDIVPRSDLWDHHNSTNFLNKLVIGRGNAVKVACDLSFQVCDSDELL